MNGSKEAVSAEIKLLKELDKILTPEQWDEIFPVIDCTRTPTSAEDEEYARQLQERLYLEDVTERNQSQPLLFNSNLTHRTDTDEAVALRMQEQEYTRPTIDIHHQNKATPNTQQPPTTVLHFDGNLVVSDEELAAHIQAEQDQENTRQSRRAPNERVNRPYRVRPSPAASTVVPNRNSNHQPSPSSNNSHRRADRGARASRRSASISPDPGHLLTENANRDFGPEDYEALIQLDEEVKKKGLSKNDIERLPTENFSHSKAAAEGENNCAICMEEFQTNDPLRRLPCLHRYHKNCIDKWLEKSGKCPVCQHKA